MEEKDKKPKKNKPDKDFSDITPPNPDEILEQKLNRTAEILKEEGIDIREKGVYIDPNGKIHIEEDL